LEDVPWFGGSLAFEPGKENERFMLTHNELRAWLKERGLSYVCISSPEEYPLVPWGQCLAYGRTVRGTSHVVVWDAVAKKMLHDPHPDGTGLEFLDGWYCFTVVDPDRFYSFVMMLHARAFYRTVALTHPIPNSAVPDELRAFVQEVARRQKETLG
jgi:hypothetical protein